MANPNPSHSTRVGPGNPGRGRQKAARDKISTTFLEALNVAFKEPTRAAARVSTRSTRFATKTRQPLPRIYATLLRKQLEIEDTSPEAALSNGQLERVYHALLADRRPAELHEKDQLVARTVN